MTAFTDSQLLLAMLNAVCGLAKRITGEEMIVKIDVDGHAVRVFGDGITWAPVFPEVAKTQLSAPE